MPTICSLEGIDIKMYCAPKEHSPAHFHVYYGEFKAVINIDTLSLLKGYLPPVKLKLVIKWANRHKEELIDNWNLVMQSQLPNKISKN